MTRKGSKNKESIPNDVLAQLNRGEIESANLVEWLAIDLKQLLYHTLVPVHRENVAQIIVQRLLDHQGKLSFVQTNAHIGRELAEWYASYKDRALLDFLSSHTSDTVRCWAAYMVGLDKSATFSEKLPRLAPFASDGHFGVRELAWMVVREDVVKHTEACIQALMPWAMHSDAYLRRFASEVTRPCGVWCAHIPLLKQRPELGLPLLEPLRADASRYVQDSVANWLNDASKSRPDFVMEVCHRWAQPYTESTAYILKRAMRSIDKGGK